MTRSIALRALRAVATQATLSTLLLLIAVPMACSREKPKAPDLSDTTLHAPPDAGSPDATANASPSWLDAIDIGPLPDASTRQAVQEERWQDALKALNAQQLDAKTHNALLTLRGHVAWRAADHARCIEDLTAATTQPSLLTEHAQRWLAECAFASSKWDEATLRTASIPPESPQHERALYLLGATLVKAGTSSDKARAVQVFDAYLTTYPGGAHAEPARIAQARLLREQANDDRAALRYNEVITYHPLVKASVDEAIAALEAMRPKLSKQVSAQIAATSDEQRIRKLRALFAKHRSDEAIADGDRYLKVFTKKSELSCEALYLVGRSYTKLRKHPESIPYYTRLIKECEGSDWAIKAHYLAGRGYWNAGDRAKARASFDQLWKTYSSHSYADDAMLYSARIAREAGDLEAMRATLKRQLKEQPRGDMIHDARWLLAQDLWSQKRYEELITLVKELPAERGEDLYSAGRLDYFAARAHEQLKQPELARERYQAVATAHPLGYYALLSLNRMARQEGFTSLSAAQDLCAEAARAKLCDFIKKPAVGAEARAPQPIVIPEALKEDARFERGGALLKLGLDAVAEQELRGLRQRFAKNDDTLWALAMLLDSVGAYPLSHDLPRRNISGWQSDYPSDVDRQRWEIAYPRPFQELVEEWATARALPPELVWAIMREESGFNPRIESWANARGLLQLMEGTGAGMAKKDGLDGFSKETLFDAPSNVRLGTAYMRELADTFESHPALIIAGYNGGAGNVNRWLKERGTLDLDMWVEEIPYGQTRDYTKRVLTSFWTYAWLYGDSATPALPFALPSPGAD